MKIAVPLTQGRFCSHFGGAESFVLYTVDLASRSVTDHEVDAPPEHGRGVFPMWLKRKGADVVLAGGMGPRAISIFAQHGISIVLGVDGGEPGSMVQRYLDGTLESTGEACHDHGFHDCGHHHRDDEQTGCQ